MATTIAKDVVYYQWYTSNNLAPFQPDCLFVLNTFLHNRVKLDLIFLMDFGVVHMQIAIFFCMYFVFNVPSTCSWNNFIPNGRACNSKWNKSFSTRTKPGSYFLQMRLRLKFCCHKFATNNSHQLTKLVLNSCKSFAAKKGKWRQD